LDTNREANYNIKNLRFGYVARDALEACMLAKQGFSGPVRVVEAEHGIAEVALKGQYDLEKMTDFFGWRMRQVRYKEMCCNANSMGHLSATLKNVRENHIKASDVAAIVIKTGGHESRHTTSLAKRFPRNAETADHSAYYVNAIAIRDHKYDVESMNPKDFDDPVIVDLIGKMRVLPDASLPEYGYAGISEITLKDGRRFVERVDMPHGLGDDVHTDEELEQKFRKMASKYFPEAHVNALIDTVWHVDTLENLTQLANLMIVRGDA
jgi:2-methylcitrate dehydratase